MRRAIRAKGWAPLAGAGLPQPSAGSIAAAACAQTLGVEERPETAEPAISQQPLDGVDQGGLIRAELGRDAVERSLDERETTLKLVDDGTLEWLESAHGVASIATRASGRRAGGAIAVARSP